MKSAKTLMAGWSVVLLVVAATSDCRAGSGGAPMKRPNGARNAPARMAKGRGGEPTAKHEQKSAIQLAAHETGTGKKEEGDKIDEGASKVVDASRSGIREEKKGSASDLLGEGLLSGELQDRSPGMVEDEAALELLTLPRILMGISPFLLMGGAIVVCLVMLRRHRLGVSQGARMQVVETIAVRPAGRLLLIAVDGGWFVAGSDSRGITCLQPVNVAFSSVLDGIAPEDGRGEDVENGSNSESDSEAERRSRSIGALERTRLTSVEFPQSVTRS